MGGNGKSHFLPLLQFMKENKSVIYTGVLFDGRYRLLRPLSSDGGTADVWLALDTNTIDDVYDEATDQTKSLEDTGIKVAIKIYRPHNALDLGEQRFREEFKIVFNCHHTNLVQPINFSIYQGIPYLVLPYCKNGSSENIQLQLNDNDELWKYISDVSAGLSYLHSFNPTIVHHDIKPANILVDDNGNYAITDFGISSQGGLNRDGYDDTHSGTMAYMAPERFDEDYESIPESDIWSLGATLYELVTGKVPFGEDGGRLQSENGENISPIEQSIPNDIKHLIYDCLSPDISKRPSAEYIHQCAIEKKYPLKNRQKIYIAGGLCSIIAIITLIIILFPNNHEQTLTETISKEERFSRAMTLMSSPEKTPLENGILILDTLVNEGYIPAIYEEAFTYGWYADSASLARKKILGIDLFTDSNNEDEKFLPKSDYINRKAISLLTKIEESNDSNYGEIKALSLYKLATYYNNSNNIFTENQTKAKELCEQALIWAEICGNKNLYDKIYKNLKIIKQSKDN